ncbi:MAG: type sorting protein [Myxococcaceae bacterium]|nr:type sorting protein [Myxococcaceae bacterium]
MKHGDSGRVAALLLVMGSGACARDNWRYPSPSDAGTPEERSPDAGTPDAGTPDVPTDLPLLDTAPDVGCGAGLVRLGAVCVPGQACPAGACTCAAGQHPLLGVCVVDAPPRPLGPLSLGDVTQLRPTLRWTLAAGYDGAVVELCRDRACTMLLATLTATGGSAQPTADLPPRAVVFWRMRAHVGTTTDTAVSPTWLFHTPALSARGGVDTSASPHLDVNGDGYDDVAIGAYTADPGGRVDAGTASVFHGAAAGLAGVAAVVLAGAAAHDRFGLSVASAGDVDGDGYGDLVVGSTPGPFSGSASPGTASVYRGSAGGIVPTAIRVFTGVSAGDTLGGSVAGVGDVDGDGYADIAIGASEASPGGHTGVGSVGLYRGSPTGTVAAPSPLLEGGARGERFGYSVSSAGDVDGDGYSDVVVGAVFGDPGSIEHAGLVRVFRGGAAGLATVAAQTLAGPSVSAQFGNQVAGLGDVNGDGYSDFVVGANGTAPGGRERAGTASIFHGSAAGVAATAALVLEGVAPIDQFGGNCGAAGDVDGDGYADLLVGAPGANGNTGAASFFRGSAAGVIAPPARVLIGGAPGDGLGGPVTGVGDVNRDGFADVFVSAWSASPGGLTNAGTTSLFHGSAAGLPATATRVFDGPRADDRFGVSVACAPPAPRRIRRSCRS